VSENAAATEYAKNGYLVVEDAICEADLQSLRGAASAIVEDFDVSQHQSVFSTLHEDRDRDQYFIDSAENVHCFLEEDALGGDGALNRPKAQAINKIGHAMHDQVPEFTTFCRLPVIGQALRDIGYQAPQLWQTMYIFKQPGIGGEVRWHQDASYLSSAAPGVTGVWIAIEDATRDNGCLWMQPGQHHSALREIYEVDWSTRTGTLRTLDETAWTAGVAEAIEVPAGSAVLFNDRMPHYSSQNLSDASRHAFTLHVAESGSAWSSGNWLQRPRLGAFKL
jgi:phytanoyl-CoA hydroxylase